jgi:RND family efflux transporter MFP subunit
MKFINKKYLKPIVIIVFTIILVKLIMANPPKSHRGRPAPVAKMSVTVMPLLPQDYQIKIDSFGTVKPRTKSALVAQVSGQITSISDHFREGGFFEKDEILVTIDARDYQAELKIAEAGVLKAEQNLLEEQARVKQAKQDWQRLGNGEKANPLVLRKPQLAAAQAQVLSAQAKFEKAQLSLERTSIIAPYSGRILSKQVDIGQVVSMNSKLAEIYATDSVEIRLPIHNSDLRFINLPEQYTKLQSNNEKSISAQITQRNESIVEFHSDLAPNQHWQGKLIRTEGSIDSNAQQLYVVAQITDPFKRQAKKAKNNDISIKIGQYLKAKISGKLLKQVLVIPNTSIYQGSYVYIVENGLLQRKEIDIAWQNDQNALITKGLIFGQQLVLTSLGQVSSGTAVQILPDKTHPKNSLNHKTKMTNYSKKSGESL